MKRSLADEWRLLWCRSGDSFLFLGGGDGECDGVVASLPVGLGIHSPSLRMTFLASLPIDWRWHVRHDLHTRNPV